MLTSIAARLVILLILVYGLSGCKPKGPALPTSQNAPPAPSEFDVGVAKTEPSDDEGAPPAAEEQGAQIEDESDQPADDLEPISEPNEEIESMTARTLVISKLNDVVSVKIGTLKFDASNQATLSIDKPGPEAEELKEVWKQISSQDELTLKRSVPDKINGRRVTRIVGKSVKPGDPSYIHAVFSTLERKHGYHVSLEN